MNIASLFSFGSGKTSTEAALPDIFPIPITSTDFVDTDCITIFRRILTEVVERTDGIPEDKQNILWDSCLASEKSDGLISLLSTAMLRRADLFLVFDPSTKVVRVAEAQESSKIRSDYRTKGESESGIFVTFKNFKVADMIRFYSALEYCAVGGLWKQGNLSKALQFKAKDLRRSVGESDAESIVAQAKAVAEALSKGKNVLIDGEDVLELLSMDVAPTQASIDFIAKKMSLYLGLPASWVTGETKSGLSDTGEGDSKAIERGLKIYFVQIIKPVCEKLLDAKLTFKTEDFRGITSALDCLRTFEATSEQFISRENKTDILNRMLGLPEGSEGDEIPEDTPPPLNPPGNEP